MKIHFKSLNKKSKQFQNGKVLFALCSTLCIFVINIACGSPILGRVGGCRYDLGKRLHDALFLAVLECDSFEKERATCTGSYAFLFIDKSQ